MTRKVDVMGGSALLSIKVKRIGTPTILEVYDTLTGQIIFDLRKGSVDLAGLQDSLREHLDQLKDQTGDRLDIQRPSRFRNTLSELYLWGRARYSEFFMSGPEKKWRALHDRFSKYYSLAANQSVDLEPRVIEVESRFNDTIPLEFFVLPGLGPEPRNITTVDGLQRAVGAFLGFRFIINRIIPHRGQSHNKSLINNPKLTMKYFLHNELGREFNSELDFFRRNHRLFDLHGPWPEIDIDEFSKAFVSHIFYADRCFDGKQKQAVDQVHHFLCHCDTTHPNSDEHYLDFSGKNMVRLKHIQAHQADCRVENENELDMPLVFLNACGSSHIRPTGMSFPKFFLESNKNRSFVGTETWVPRAVASEFSKRIYLNLLTGKSLAEALQLAKWELVTKYRNPLGILYTLYGIHDLKVTNPVKPEDVVIINDGNISPSLR